DGDCYRRTIQLNSVAGVIELRRVANEAYLLMHVWLPSYECVMKVAERARRIFDLGADPLQIAEHLRRCPALADVLAAAPGGRVRWIRGCRARRARTAGPSGARNNFGRASGASLRRANAGL